MSDRVVLSAAAKLNLALAVGPPDAGGWHPICSWMVTIDLCDELEVRRLPPDRLSRYAILWHQEARQRSEIDWPITRDLAVRAHLALERRAGRPLPVELRLEKRVPVGAGLGGGSADAAAMLHAVNELHGLGLSTRELAAFGSEIGSDVPFLVHGGSATVEGRGGSISAHAGVPDLHAVVVLVPVACPTAEVYRAYDAEGPGELRREAIAALTGVSGGRPAPPAPAAPFNDLAPAAFRVAPRLREDLALVAAIAGRPAHLTGSGSSLFVICDDPPHAEHLAAEIERESGLAALPARRPRAAPAAGPSRPPEARRGAAV